MHEWCQEFLWELPHFEMKYLLSGDRHKSQINCIFKETLYISKAAILKLVTIIDYSNVCSIILVDHKNSSGICIFGNRLNIAS